MSGESSRFLSSLPGNVLYYGRPEPLPTRTQLRAGPLSLVFEDGDLRNIRLGETEILRRIYVAVRDHNWGTIPPVLSGYFLSEFHEGFRVGYTVDHKRGDIHFRWVASIEGEADGAITFTMDGKAMTTFRRNRIGFCILHPIRECTGKPCKVEKTDGTVLSGVFPAEVSPHQPFLDIRAITHEVAPGFEAEVRFTGDVFEMEDQRNWTDASYKIYSTPLSLPLPAEVKAGTEITQTVRLTLRGKRPEPAAVPPSRRPVAFTFDRGTAVPLPRIGLEHAASTPLLDDGQVERLKALHLSHLRVDVELSKDGADSILQTAVANAGKLDVPLEAALFLSDAAEEELATLRGLLKKLKPRVARWLIFHVQEKSTQPKWVVLARNRLAAYDPEAKFVCGANAYFTHLNRGRPDASVVDGVCFSLNPQSHAFDHYTLVENLETQAVGIQTARSFSAGKPVYVTPVTLRPRFSPGATGPEIPPPPGELPSQVDPRQMSLFGAGWTVGSLKYVAQGRAAAATYYQVLGWRGVMETSQGSLLPERFHSIPGAVFPLYHVLADVAEFRGGEVLASRSDRPLEVEGMVLRWHRRLRILLANLGPDPQRVRLESKSLGRRPRLRWIDETNAEDAMKDPARFRKHSGIPLEVAGEWIEISLRPFAVARIDCADLGKGDG